MTLVGIIVLISVILFQAGIIESYRINLDELSVLDQIVYFAVFFCVCVALCVGSLITARQDDQELTPVMTKRAKSVSTLCLVISTVAVLLLAVELISKYGLQEFLYGSLRGYMKNDSAFDERPYLAFSILPLISGPLCTYNRENDSSYVLHMAWGFVIMTLFSLMYASRIMILEYLIFSAVVWLRKFHFGISISTKSLLLALVLILTMLVATSAVRDYESVGQRYTDNPVEWGVSRLVDYPLSSYEYSVFLLNDGGAKEASFSDLVPTVGRFTGELSSDAFSASDSLLTFFESRDVGASEYTNRGAIGDLFQYRPSLLGALLLIVYTILCIVSWLSFKQGTIAGYLTYPVFLYSIVEFWRYGVFLTEIPQLLLLLGLLTSMYISKKEPASSRFRQPSVARR